MARPPLQYARKGLQLIAVKPLVPNLHHLNVEVVDSVVYRPNIDKHLCFVLMPFQDLHQQYFKGIIAPAVESLGLVARKADDIYGTAPIIDDIWRSIWTAEVVIADVTGKNPNVNYELGLSHALGVPTILMTQDMVDVPFDYRHLRCIVYDTRQVDWQEKLRNSLINTLKVLLAGPDVSEDLRWPYDTALLKSSGGGGIFVPAEEARESLSRAMRGAADIVSRATGIYGSSVSSKSEYGSEKAHRSGVAIASALSSADPLAQQGLSQILEVGREVAAEVGDGTKTAILVFCEMVLRGFSELQRGAISRDLIHEMDLAVESVTKFLVERSEAIDQRKSIAVATTAALGDGLCGRVVHDALSKAGKDGVILLEDHAGPDTIVSVREGMYFDRGFISNRFVTDETRQLAVLEDAYILLCESKLSSMRQLLPVLEQVAKSGRSLLVVAEDVDGEALATLLVNQQKQTLPSVAVKAPGYSTRRDLLEDIAAATGGNVVEHVSQLENVRLSDLGQADRIEVSSSSTWLIGSRGSQTLVNSRAAGIRQQIAVGGADFEMDALRRRIAKLVGATVVIRVGGVSAADRDERRYRIEAALYATRSALSSGVLIGGGNALWRASENVAASLVSTGSVIVRNSIAAPLLAQIRNSRADPERILNGMAAEPYATGFNASGRSIENLLRAGILDATTVVVRGLQIAFAQARRVLQTGAWDISTARDLNDRLSGPRIPNL